MRILLSEKSSLLGKNTEDTIYKKLLFYIMDNGGIRSKNIVWRNSIHKSTFIN